MNGSEPQAEMRPTRRRRPTGYYPEQTFSFHDLPKKMNRKKTLEEDLLRTPLKRCLNTFDICMLGVGHMIGAGIYVLTGEVAKATSGPGILISYVIAGITSILAAVCYAEFGTRVPKAGSAYVYTYVTIGEFWAFIIGWDVVLEHMIGAASVARAWSGYLNDLVDNAIKNGTMEFIGTFKVEYISEYPDFLAFGVCLVVCIFLIVGVKFSSYFNSIFTIINLGVILFVVCAGFYYADIRNWTEVRGGFMPFGFAGVVAGAAKCFFAFVGFDSIATSSEEAKTPSRSIPLATFLCMIIATTAYCLMSSILTLMVPYNTIDPESAFPHAFKDNDASWAQYVVTAGALAGMTTTMFGSLFALPRTIYAMATDGLLFQFFAYVHPRTQTPIITFLVCSLLTALIALLFDIGKLVEFMSIGTLMAYTFVSISTIMLRYQPSKNPIIVYEDHLGKSSSTLVIDKGGKLRYHLKAFQIFERFQPGFIATIATVSLAISIVILCLTIQFAIEYIIKLQWWAILVLTLACASIAFFIFILYIHEQSSQKLIFKVPLVPLFPALSILCNVYLLVNLEWMSWVRFAVWMLIGLSIYFFYGMHHSKEGNFRLRIKPNIILPEQMSPSVANGKHDNPENYLPKDYITKF